MQHNRKADVMQSTEMSASSDTQTHTQAAAAKLKKRAAAQHSSICKHACRLIRCTHTSASSPKT